MDDDYRWARITPDDHSGAVYIVTFISFTYGSLTFLTRLLIKWHLLGLDDLVMLAAQMYAGTQIAIYISLGFSKLASILLVRRLFIRDMKSAWTICNAITALIVAWTIASAALVSVGCSTDRLSPRTPSDICPGIEARYLFVVITDGMTDLILAFIPTYLCRHLQMNMLFKLQVFGVFALRLPVLALAGVFYKAWSASMHSDNPGVDRTTSLVYQQCQLCCSLIAATIPCLKSFIQSFDTGSGQKAGFGYSSHSGAYGHMSSVHHSVVQVDDGENYQMSRLNQKRQGGSRFGRSGNGSQAVRVNRKSATDVGSALGDALELERRSTQESDRKSQQSTQELVIRKDVQFDVRREPAKDNEMHRPGLLRLPK
ncbi:hypothetical protein N0V86_007664 [Didymella sp. IMI 355093]|nr:hypothetical protein N0V86_007664 [Didymella sp. IMI 355093]